MSDYRIKLFLVVIKEGDEEAVYFDAFSDMDIDRTISSEYSKAITQLDIPFNEYFTVVEEFESKFSDCSKVKKDNQVLPMKTGFTFSFEKYFEVMEWIEFENKKYNLKKVK